MCFFRCVLRCLKSIINGVFPDEHCTTVSQLVEPVLPNLNFLPAFDISNCSLISKMVIINHTLMKTSDSSGLRLAYQVENAFTFVLPDLKLNMPMLMYRKRQTYFVDYFMHGKFPPVATYVSYCKHLIWICSFANSKSISG